LQLKAENYVRFSTKTNGMQLTVMVLGAVVNLIIGSIALCLSNLELLSFLGVFALCNWYKAISNLLPIGKRDGLVCLQILRERNK
jgi:Zn-dependent protease